MSTQCFFPFCLDIFLQRSLEEIFKKLNIPTKYVEVALTALDKHSQNNMLYDPNEALDIPASYLAQCDIAFEVMGFPFNTKSKYEEYAQYVIWLIR